MALSNAQYDEIMRGYDERQLQIRHITAMRLSEAYKKEPRLKEIDNAIASCSVKQAEKLLDGDKNALDTLKMQIKAFRDEKKDIFLSLGYPDDYFEPVYSCPDCKDTGSINGIRCHCFKQAVINTVYSQSNIRDILDRENFSSFSFDYFSDEDTNPATGLTSLQTMQNAVRECQNFINDFDNKPKNLFLYGNTGVGKTFLSNCVAKELLDRGYSVIYFTAFQFVYYITAIFMHK